MFAVKTVACLFRVFVSSLLDEFIRRGDRIQAYHHDDVTGERGIQAPSPELHPRAGAPTPLWKSGAPPPGGRRAPPSPRHPGPTGAPGPSGRWGPRRRAKGTETLWRAGALFRHM